MNPTLKLDPMVPCQEQPRTVVFNGAGLVGIEMCGDLRARIGLRDLHGD